MVIKAIIKKKLDGNKPIKAYADVSIDDSIVIHGVAVVESEKGRYISMPFAKWTNKDGEEKTRDIVHPITSSARKQIESAVFAAYDSYSENN